LKLLSRPTLTTRTPRRRNVDLRPTTSCKTALSLFTFAIREILTCCELCTNSLTPIIGMVDRREVS
jgi:hypothetical protein